MKYKHPMILEMEQKSQKINYQEILLNICESHYENNERPKILIHCCCAVCSTTALLTLSKYMDITIFFYNPNIHPKKEFLKRAKVQKDFIDEFNKEYNYNIKYLEGEYKPVEFFDITKGLEEEKEGTGKRCAVCYGMRLEKAAVMAKDLNCDYFATALTLSPMKNSDVINKIGFEVGEAFNVYYLPSDFKKNNGNLNSKSMCEKYNIYRQCYCGCIFSMQERNISIRDVLKKEQ